MGTPVLILLKTVFKSILEVFLLCLAGWLLARFDILDKRTQKQLNRINVSLFTPALLFSKVAFSLSPEKLKELWIIPIFFVLVTFVSWSVAQIMSRLLRLKPSQRNFATAAAMFMNSNSLPIALMQSLTATVPNLKWGSDDSKSAMLGRALSYLVLFSTLGMILRWSYGVHILTKSDEINLPTTISPGESLSTHIANAPKQLGYQGYNPKRETIPATLVDAAPNGEDSVSSGGPSLLYRDDQPPAASSSRAQLAPLSIHTQSEPTHEVDANDTEESSHVISGHRLSDASSLTLTAEEAARRGVNPSSHMFYSFPNTPVRSQDHMRPEGTMGGQPDDSSETESGAADEPIHFETTFSHKKEDPQSFLHKIKIRAGRFLHALNEFMTVPLYASFLSIIVALVPSLQHVLNEHLDPIKGALLNAGGCSIPITLVVLGGYFWTPPEDRADGLIQKRESTVSFLSASLKNAFRLKSSTKHANPVSHHNATAADTLNNTIYNTHPPQRHNRVRPCRQKSILAARSEDARPGESKTVFVAVFSRMVIVPMVLMPLFVYSTWTDWHAVFEDPVFVVSSVLLVSSPPALTLAQITQKASGDAFERLISRTIFWAYCIVTPVATIGYVVVGLRLSQL